MREAAEATKILIAELSTDSFVPAIPCRGMLRWVEAVLDENEVVVVDGFQEGVDAAVALALDLQHLLPNTKPFTEPIYLHDLAKKTLLAKRSREAVNQLDENLDKAMEMIGAAGRQLLPGKTSDEIVADFPKIAECEAVSTTSHGVVLLTAIVSAMAEKPSEQRSKDLKFLLGSGGVPETVATAARLAAACTMPVAVPAAPVCKRQKISHKAPVIAAVRAKR